LKCHQNIKDHEPVTLKKFPTLLIILSLFAGLSVQSGYAQTQPEIQLESVSLQLLPEFDQPSVYVIYEILLNEARPLPEELLIEVPAEAQVLNVLNFSPQGRPVELTYEESQIGYWKDLRFSPTGYRNRVAFQDPNLVRQGNERGYELQWLSTYPVKALSVTVRRPLGASEIVSQPALNGLADLLEGYQYYSAEFGAVSAGELFTLTLSYTKDTAAFPALPVVPAVPIDDNAQGRTPSPVSVILWLLLTSVTIVIIVTLYHLWVRASLADKRERIVQGVGILNPEKQVYFCHECGMRSKLGDSYCSNCGTELRKPTPFNTPPST
jgi:hypothetical protein